ncbi:MAG: hypothetical protein KDB60_16965 [Propionibacteriaceae bacterium]|nr:hypothetical protein [Propionibacteriaceae bacterium]
MDPVLVVVVVLVVGGLIATWFVLRNRRATPVDDEWTLPPEDEPSAPGEPIRQVLTREALVDPDRRLDPSKWDNSPDGEPEEVEGDLPTHFDREYLRKRQEE